MDTKKGNKKESPFTKDDLSQIVSLGTTSARVIEQIEIFKKGIPFVVLHRPCRLGDGILQIAEGDIERLKAVHDRAAASGRVMKFTPASGAASRMFKLLLSFYNHEDSINGEEILTRAARGEKEFEELLEFMDNLSSFAFHRELEGIMADAGLDLESLSGSRKYKPVLDYLLSEKGLNYANLPKGLIIFHSYGNECRTPFEEHLIEAEAYSKDSKGLCRVHFTISPEYAEIIKDRIDNFINQNKEEGHTFEVTYSAQSPSTDTIAVDGENRAFRDDKGRLLFRPGGHGALLKNLEELKGDILFVKNIDNVVPDRLKDTTILYKKIIGGYLLELQESIFDILRQIESGKEGEDFLNRALEFARKKLFIEVPDRIKGAQRDEMVHFIEEKLNRPIRVCGMVKNEGEPGGGPFWVRGRNGEVSLQIVEKSQVDLKSASQLKSLESSTHFNPVDLVCGMRNYRGESFQLSDFSDPETGFISLKSFEGRELKALELPGLWNGAMANWITIFIEVPIITFNPVKTVLDLLREEHQP